MKLPKRSSPANSDASNRFASDDEAETPEKVIRRALVRTVRKKDPKPAKLIAYDFETSRIAKGTPRPLYITAYGESPAMHYESAIDDMEHLRLILKSQFLTEENLGVKYVAWNGNNFDAYFVAAAMLTDDEYTLRPYLTRSGSLRGLRIIRRGDENNQKAPSWEFLDGIAMLGLAGTNLDKFTANFAPNHRKMTGVIDFEREEFDSNNPKHCEYAMQDSIGLYHGMINAQNILMENFEQPLAVTMGGACIRIFKAHIPEGVRVEPLDDRQMEIIREHVLRGGFCFCQTRYDGPVWKYDINQAYAAAMRDAELPQGRAFHTANGIHKYARTFIVRITATNPRNIIPFYHRAVIDGKLKAAFSVTEIADAWITSSEYHQLKAEGWKITAHESYTWEDHFSMRDYVQKLERVRMTCEGGPSGPIGTMTKAVGNHSYGKTLEKLEPIEFIIASEPPSEEWQPYYADEITPLEHVYFRWQEEKPKEYHQPHVGAFITAHVRMVLRRAALLAPEAWLYADTDCVVFSRDVTAQMDCDSKRYGAWKIEEEGARYKIIAKKVYTQTDAPGKNKRSAKGLNVKRLSDDDFASWFEGKAPTQTQVQRNNFLKVMQGAEMYREQVRRGTAIELKR